ALSYASTVTLVFWSVHSFNNRRNPFRPGQRNCSIQKSQASQVIGLVRRSSLQLVSAIYISRPDCAPLQHPLGSLPRSQVDWCLITALTEPATPREFLCGCARSRGLERPT